MAEQKNATVNNNQAAATKVDALYSWLSYDLQKLKKELLNEMKYSSVQIGSLNSEIKGEQEKASKNISQEIRYGYIQNQSIYDGLTASINDTIAKIDEAIARLDAFASEELAEGVKEKVAGILPPIEDTLNEIKLSYLQHQSIYEDLKTLINENVVAKFDDVNARFTLVEQMDESLEEIRQKISDLAETLESADHKNLVDQIVAAVPVAENVDYVRIADDVGDKVLELLGDVLVQQPEKEQEPVEAKIDYDRIIYGAAEKVVESLPYPEKVDYRRIDDSFAAAAAKVQGGIAQDVLSAVVATAVANAIAAIDLDAIAAKVAEKVQPAPCEIDYDKLADMVAAKLSADETEEETTFDFVIDDEGIDVIATRVSAKLCEMCANCEETVEEIVEEPAVEEVVEEIVEEAPVEEIVEEAVEEIVEEPAVEEIAVAKEPVYEEVEGELVDAETGMVIRLKRSFTAKMSQSADEVKAYYSDLKNALLAYKKVRSNVSWHGDRFNYGRETVAKMGINGKTLCFYLALDPTDEENFKTTVYHQKNVGDQKAHEATPFMVKVKSAAAVKKAVRLVEALAAKFEAEKKEDAETVDFAQEYPYASTKQLLSDGHIKLTKEKKVEFNF